MKEFKTTLPSGLYVERRVSTVTTTDYMYAINEFAFKDLASILTELAEQDWGNTLSVTVYINSSNEEEDTDEQK